MRRTRPVVLDPELKVRGTIVNAVPNITTPTIIPLTLLATGTEANERIGNQVLFRSVQWRLSALQGGDFSQLRIMLILDKMPNGQLLVAADILDDVAVPIQSPLNLANNKRLRVLYSRTMVWSSGKSLIVFNSHYMKQYMLVRYNGNGTNIGAVTSNSLYFVLFSDADAGAGPAIALTLRQRFVG